MAQKRSTSMNSMNSPSVIPGAGGVLREAVGAHYEGSSVTSMNSVVRLQHGVPLWLLEHAPVATHATLTWTCHYTC